MNRLRLWHSIRLITSLAVVVCVLLTGCASTGEAEHTAQAVVVTSTTLAETAVTPMTEPTAVATQTTMTSETVAFGENATTTSCAEEPIFDEQCQPIFLSDTLAANGYSYNDLNDRACRQLMVVVGNGHRADISLYELNDGVWSDKAELHCTGNLGYNGLSANKKEGDGCTPIGLFTIGSAFYQTDVPPETNLDCFQITENSYWVDDPNSAYYNQYVTDTSVKDWNSAEHMIDYPGYEYGFVINYNPECVKGEGSAVFFHIGEGYTAACIATSKNNCLQYIATLDKARNPCVLLVPTR